MRRISHIVLAAACVASFGVMIVRAVDAGPRMIDITVQLRKFRHESQPIPTGLAFFTSHGLGHFAFPQAGGAR